MTAEIAPSETAPSEVGPDEAMTPSEEARAAVTVGLWVSAVRCILTYVVAPALGALGVLLGPVGLVLQVAGAITSAAGATRLWRLGHRLRWPYAAVALAIDLVTVLVLVLAQTTQEWIR